MTLHRLFHCKAYSTSYIYIYIPAGQNDYCYVIVPAIYKLDFLKVKVRL